MTDHNEWGPWIEHDGKGCPVVGQFVTVEDASGTQEKGIPDIKCDKPDPGCASTWVWESLRPLLLIHHRVIRYRVRRDPMETKGGWNMGETMTKPVDCPNCGRKPLFGMCAYVGDGPAPCSVLCPTCGLTVGSDRLFPGGRSEAAAAWNKMIETRDYNGVIRRGTSWQVWVGGKMVAERPTQREAWRDYDRAVNEVVSRQEDLTEWRSKL